jgi:ABC-type lipoprotein export system ATPase subunit
VQLELIEAAAARATPAVQAALAARDAALAKNPEVLLCDEPTGALDCATGVMVLQAIEHVNRELGTTTVVITHNAPIAEMADREAFLTLCPSVRRAAHRAGVA